MSDLPFQWDDGVFVSPFVAASESDMAAFATWLTARYLAPLAQRTTTAAREPHALQSSMEMRLTDLGCGDATAVLALAKHIRQGWCDLQSGADHGTPLRLLVTGVDLDAALLEAAAAHASAFATAVASPSSSPVSVEAYLVCQDICVADMDVFFPRCVDGGAATSPAPTRPPYVLYMYLLPDALELLRERLVRVLQRGWVVASNRWPIPGLDNCLRERAGHVHIYHGVSEDSSA